MRSATAALKDRRGWISRAPVPRWRRMLVAAGVCLLVGGCVNVASAAPRAGAVLRVGSYQGVPGQYSDIQKAIDAARPGDWVLIGPGDHKATGDRVLPGATGYNRSGAALMVTTPAIHIRGMDRNEVMLDGTKEGTPKCSPAEADQNFGRLTSDGKHSGRDGLEIWKASDVSVENLSVCNFLSGPLGGGNPLIFNGGSQSGIAQLGRFRGAFLSSTTTYYGGPSAPAGEYGMFSVASYGPGMWTQVYANNFNDSAFYIGACRLCQVVLDHAHGQNSAEGYSGTNSSEYVTIQYSEFDQNMVGLATDSENKADPPPPQDGHCPGDKKGKTGTDSCWLLTRSKIHDNNNPNVPVAAFENALPVGTGVLVSGGRFDTIFDNEIYNNGAWGVLLVPFPDTGKPTPVSHCQGGVQILSICYFDDWGIEVANNKMNNNAFFGNPTNADLAEISNLHLYGNCFHDNVDASGATVGFTHMQLGDKKVTTAPLFVSHNCGTPSFGASPVSILGLETACNSQELGTCPVTPFTKYPRMTQVEMKPLPPQPSMPDPCLGVPRNPWCPTNPVLPPIYPVPGPPVTLPGQEGETS